MTSAKIPKKRASKAEIAAWLEVSERTITDYVGRLGLKPDAQGNYAVLACYRERQRREENDNRKPPIADGDDPPVCTWSDVEKRERVNKLRIEIQSLRDELIPVDEVRSTLAEHAAAVKGALQNFVERVSSTKRDPQLKEWAEHARAAALQGIVDNLTSNASAD